MRAKIISNRVDGFVANNKKVLEVEACKVVIPDFEWLEVFATPFVDKSGDITDQWTITDAVSGACLNYSSYASIESAIEGVRSDLFREQMTPEKFAEARERTLQQAREHGFIYDEEK